ncbi:MULTISPECIES: ExbD/TolR family protein [Methylovorus]|jgi:biopolymer transport protein ExbD/biopolymer transport protein TolR|uniref:Biopolymer transport protein ExbD/TolR n=1 Tax=Methylovorus glucosotrophus (strain SIP3-4) TaxID=582744 RepID=C6X884_METGS|nr:MULTISPECIES: biopolymer transporter ExbD [Methylovorus]ACT49354.1 Biopolymer transport protein ExbD/TolR [Methylovorus glucosotrophus SIP3-4]ADQ83314.1 Biopolymer transport protein ExbD/TolR [Methylovorus sp. MP688]KAF0835986.1 outer membrane transport energization protein ExbD [Methylovorus glucosotrophus]MCB5207082.1 biopolymer transporter ExbD [Methylovorus mays]
MAFSTSNDADEVLSEINITPLVDVMLVLLVAFIVTIPVLNNAITVNLPKTAPTQPAEQKKAVSLSVDAQGKVFIDKRELAVADVERELKALHAADPDLSLHLSSDESVNYGTVAKVMAAIERAGITRLAVLTNAE